MSGEGRASADAAAGDYYEVTDVPFPEAVEGKVDGLAFLPDGRLAVACLEGGRVILYDPDADEWTLFAEGLHEPLGLVAPSNEELVTMQRPELTRVTDANGDGFADRYETVSDEFGLSGNYDEFGNGPAVDGAGTFYVTLATAYGPPEEEVRGELREAGLDFVRESAVPYRGWVLKVTSEGETTPWASGFRAPNGVAVDSEDRVFVTDQQGEWVGTSPLYHIREGEFYGFPSALVWRDDLDPGEMSPEQLDALRTRPAVEFPYGDVAVATTGLVEDTTGGAFGPFDGQLFVADFAMPHVVRVMLDEVAGALQGACARAMTHGGRGGHRVAFGPDGDLWIGFTGRETNWRGGRGVKRISWTGETPMAVADTTLTRNGFDLRFSKPVAPETVSPDAVECERYYYAYSRAYGSDKMDRTDVSVTGVERSDDGRRVALSLSELRPGYIHALTLDGVRSADGESLSHESVYYTLNRLLDGTTGNPQFE